MYKKLRKKVGLIDKKMIFMNGKIFFSLITVILIVCLSGCFELTNINDGSITYQAHPTKVSYTISYGYYVNLSGTGDFDLKYDCFLPADYKSLVTFLPLYNQSYELKTIEYNKFYKWNIQDNGNNRYTLGAIADIESESTLIYDLNGNQAASILEIQNNYPNIYSQFTKAQSDDGIIYVDPDNPIFKSIVENAIVEVGNNNSFLIAKQLFIWLKQNTNYQTHGSDGGNIQPASVTYDYKTGDCDDLSVLYISLCRSAGIPARFIRGYLIEQNYNNFAVVAHAWAEIFVGGNIGNNGWVPVECACESENIDTQINQNFGVETIGHLRIYTGYGTNDSFNRSMSGPSIKYSENLNVKMESFIDVKNYVILEEKELVVDKDNYRSYQ